MLSFFKKLFGKAAPQPVIPRLAAPRAVSAGADPAQPRAQMEVAHLSLAAILVKLPEDLRQTVVQEPDDSVTVALPLATIHKQLPSGSVKMSLASLYRQTPAGVFANQARYEGKRMIEVPLSEIFRHVKPQGLKRRVDQRRVEIPADAYELFSDRENPYAVSPGIPEAQPESLAEPEAVQIALPDPGAAQTLQPSGELLSGNGASHSFVPSPAAATPRLVAKPALQPTQTPVPVPLPILAAAQSVRVEQKPGGDTLGSDQSPLMLPIAALCEHWPEPIRAEALALQTANVVLPIASITSGVAKGKVTFSWAQIRSWVVPPVTAATQAREATELVLPLKIVAPAFLAHQRPGSARKTIVFDESIPVLFSGGEAAQPVAALPEPAEVSSPPSIAGPVIEPPPPEPISIPAPAESAPAVAPVPERRAPQSIGEILGKAEKTHWTPHELLKAATTLPGVKGAVIGLHEGLVVSAELPDEIKGDTVAAFLPQMFARLNNYTSEMKLGDVDELLFTTHDAHFQAYRLGEVYLGVLGKAGEALPWDGLRLVVDQLVRQSSK